MILIMLQLVDFKQNVVLVYERIVVSNLVSEIANNNVDKNNKHDHKREYNCEYNQSVDTIINHKFINIYKRSVSHKHGEIAILFNDVEITMRKHDSLFNLLRLCNFMLAFHFHFYFSFCFCFDFNNLVYYE